MILRNRWTYSLQRLYKSLESSTTSLCMRMIRFTTIMEPYSTCRESDYQQSLYMLISKLSGIDVNASLAGRPLGSRTYLIGTLAARNSTGQATNTAVIPISTSPPSGNRSNGPPASMIALYVIISIIAAIFILMVLVGAHRARRDPQRYGRRSGYGDQPPQSRTRGIAQAILDTFPVIKFNQPKQGQQGTPKRLSSERDVHSMSMLEARSPSTKETHRSPFGGSIIEGHESRHSYGNSKDGDDIFDVASGSGSSMTTEQRRSKSFMTHNGSRRTSGNDMQHQALIDEAGQESSQDQCPICLIDFEEGDDLRVLPCEREHVYHQGCIDPWCVLPKNSRAPHLSIHRLLQVSGSCPLCRKGNPHFFDTLYTC
jgi:hypothetical protein